MESIGDILKQLPVSSRRAQAEQKMTELLNDPLIVQFRTKYPELDDRSLRINLNKLYQYVTEYRRCMQCPGLENCPNDFRGHYTKLSAETVNGHALVYDRKVPCKKLISFERQQSIQNRVRSFYVDETALKQGYSASEILENDIERSDAVLTIIEYIEHTKKQGLHPQGLYLVGPFGTGKTFLMSYVLYELARADCTGVIVYMPEFVEELKSMFQEPQRLRDTIEMMKETDLLVFDDIGAENITPWVRDHVLGSILNYRMNRKPTFYTSNYDLDALLKHFSYTREGEDIHKAERLMNRIRPFVNVVQVDGRNKRGSMDT
ncbi:primosomal protein DnaI [Paenibacillus apiarius]|uniref:Primosomal protein DnaI n=1 Tax=Paenibacillus apiarius TaxID=46240 RepID=A0ABT4DYU0_9BACL|nr:primosomal protein DnaI [Paenibacillus apiarius]MBN3525513.1 primosomal protein DnaI [Paenibacillus apiarius]MCY9512638.1 primosomal protein DnaI [Paenibacillus apiarius]MCY9522395.1 primosomal protein DnaI [Paenibacillus apiarius]MCY9553640.1 primosomal protein DnaI [Paenibacillus apiarius]MCY9556584.1 primosomal protein DnaI [Paenibacillus apiarius]